MPFKTRNNAGLQILEETPDYIQYICKEAVMTFAEQYVVGAYDTFMLRMRDIESSKELMRSYNISWDSQDNINLFHEINNAELDKLANTPSLLPESENYQPLVLEGRAVPVDYDCCFTVRKDDNYSLYINEGYENYVLQNPVSTSSYTVEILDGDKIKFKVLKDFTLSNYLDLGGFVNSQKAYCGFEIIKNDSITLGTSGFGINFLGDVGTQTAGTKKSAIYQHSVSWVWRININARVQGGGSDYQSLVAGQEVILKNPILTQGETPKPFVKTIQPNCKMAFNTPANINTHSFIIKNSNSNKSSGYFDTLITGDYYVNFVFTINDCLSSSIFSNGRVINYFKEKGSLYITNPFNKDDALNSFSQLLFYKGNLTEAELKAELAKNIKII